MSPDGSVADREGRVGEVMRWSMTSGGAGQQGSTPETRPWLKNVRIGCGRLIVVLVAVIAVVFFTVGRLTAEPERVATGFLRAAAAGDYAKAHDSFSVPLKESQPLDAFTARVRATPSMFDVTDISFSGRSIDASSGATLEGTATLRSGTRVPISFSVVQENGGWKLLAYSIGATR